MRHSIRLFISWLVICYAILVDDQIRSAATIVPRYICNHPLYVGIFMFIMIAPFCYDLTTFRMKWHYVVWFILVEYYEQINPWFTAIFGVTLLVTTYFFVNHVLPYHTVVMLEAYNRTATEAALENAAL